MKVLLAAAALVSQALAVAPAGKAQRDRRDLNGRHDEFGNVIEGLSEYELAVTNSGFLGDTPPTIEFWSNLPEKTRGSPPYPYPASRKYNTKGGPVPGKINVHLVPHSHDDTGWLITVDQYFTKNVYYVIDTVVDSLARDPNRKFIYVEIAFFARWWEQAPDDRRDLVRNLVAAKQLEFINGGWCMHDEASPLWTDMVDQTTRGHQFLIKNFGPAANPRGTWQIDPFGHSNTEAWLLGAEAGFESLFWGRMDWQDRSARYQGPGSHLGFEFIWEGSASLGDSAQLFAGNLFGNGGGGYSTWVNFNDDGDQVNDDPARHDWNVDMWVDKVVQNAQNQANHTLSEHQLWACGTDFNFQNAEHWYRNLDKLIHYVNMNGTINMFYSTPSIYTDEKKKWSGSYERRTDDIFPLGDHSHNYWSGYFTSRPALKRQVRFSTNLLFAARQLEVITNTSAAEVDLPTFKKEPPVGTSWTDSLEGTVGVATHHDGMSGTEKQSVTNDYEQRISESSVEVEKGVSVSLAKLLGLQPEAIQHCNCNVGANCLNMSVCAASTGKSAFTVIAWNPLAHAVDKQVVRLPVSGAAWKVVDASNQTLLSQVVPLDQRTKSLPLLYLNKFNLTDAQIAQAQADLANKATHELIFVMALPPVGMATATATALPKDQRTVLELDELAPVAGLGAVEGPDPPLLVESDTYKLAFDATTGLLSTITNKASGISTDLAITWGWYNASVGGCTDFSQIPKELWDLDGPCSDQISGAYIMRTNSSTVFYPGAPRTPTVEVVRGPLVTEIRQTFSEWASHVIRLYEGRAYVELEWTAGPIPIDTPWMPPVAHHELKPLPNNWGKEVIVKYQSALASNGTWYTDSNGKEMVQRKYNLRGPSYPKPYRISEPIAGNYYPVNAMMTLDDGANELAILTDVSQGGASLADGELEFLVHRRLQDDDHRGVGEPLNETMCQCNDIGAGIGGTGAHGHEGDGGCLCEGLTIRGRHWIVFDTIERSHEIRRVLSEQLNFPPLLALAPPVVRGTTFSAVSAALPPNVKLVTLTSNYASFNDGQWLLRLSHLYEAGEHPTLAQPVTLNLQEVFGKAGLKISGAVETSLTANRNKDEMEAAKHKCAC